MNPALERPTTTGDVARTREGHERRGRGRRAPADDQGEINRAQQDLAFRANPPELDAGARISERVDHDHLCNVAVRGDNPLRGSSIERTHRCGACDEIATQLDTPLDGDGDRLTGQRAGNDREFRQCGKPRLGCNVDHHGAAGSNRQLDRIERHAAVGHDLQVDLSRLIGGIGHMDAVEEPEFGRNDGTTLSTEPS